MEKKEINKKISIIVPVYNTEKYLDKCLDRLANQTLEDIEIIVVNDGSPDNSQEIIDKYYKLYPNKIKAYKKENGGISSTRNFGLSKASGEYIGFIDSDDYLEYDMFEKLYNKAVSGNFDVTICNTTLFYEDNTYEKTLQMSINKDIINKEKVKKSMNYFYPVLWDKIIKRELIYNEDGTYLEFQYGVWYEDMQWLIKLYPKISSIGVVNESLHFYLQRGQSITYTYNDKLYDIIKNMDNVIDYYKSKNIYNEYKEEIEYLYSRYAFATFMKRLAKSKDKKVYKKGYEYAIKKVNDTFPNYRKNKYLKENGLKGYYIKYFNRFLANLNYLIEKNKKYN